MPKSPLHQLWEHASERLTRTPKRTPRRTPQTAPSLLVFSAHPECPECPEYDDVPDLPFLLIRDCFRTIRITVRRDGTVRVKAPFLTKDADVLRAIGQKRAWIEMKRHAFLQSPTPPPHDYRDGDIFYYVGRPFPLLLCQTPPFIGTKPVPLSARLQGKNLVVYGDDLNPERVHKAIVLWRNAVSRTLFAKRLARLHKKLCDALGDDMPLPVWKLRMLKRRWGSCARRQRTSMQDTTKQRFAVLPTPSRVTHHEITLARHLSAVPLACMDYVIVHELCHMRHMDHSPRFYALLNRMLPDAPHISRRLDAWSLAHGRDESTPNKA